MCFAIFHKMGQILYNLWKFLRPKPRIETPTLIIDDHQANHLTTSLDETADELKSHCIDIFDHHIEPVSGSSRVEIVEDHEINLGLTTSTTPHIVVEFNSEIENNAKTKKEQVIISSEIVLEKNVTTKVVNHVPKEIIGKIGQYSSVQKLLLVGEGDFSFSACLAVAFGTSAHNITATSLNSKGFLKKNYAKFITNKAELRTRGSRVLHGIDATKMLKHPVIGSMVFDRIIFNFPHAGKFGHTDIELRLHQKLVRGFLKNAKKMIGEDGEIHITSKSNGFYLEWDIPKIGSDHGLNLIQEMKFRRSKYPGYNTKYGFGGDKDFDCDPSKTYKFALSPK